MSDRTPPPPPDPADLPRGVVPFPEQEPPHRGCVVRGCLGCAVTVFALLLVAMLLVLVFRVWNVPAGVR